METFQYWQIVLKITILAYYAKYKKQQQQIVSHQQNNEAYHTFLDGTICDNSNNNKSNCVRISEYKTNIHICICVYICTYVGMILIASMPNRKRIQKQIFEFTCELVPALLFPLHSFDFLRLFCNIFLYTYRITYTSIYNVKIIYSWEDTYILRSHTENL